MFLLLNMRSSSSLLIRVEKSDDLLNAIFIPQHFIQLDLVMNPHPPTTTSAYES